MRRPAHEGRTPLLRRVAEPGRSSYSRQHDCITIRAHTSRPMGHPAFSIHRSRTDTVRRTLNSMTKPTVFVGSSSEGLEIARAVQFQLKDDALVTVWNEGAFSLNQGTLESLVAMLDRFDFAVLLLTPDDVLQVRDTALLTPRDNVMFELGLFLGRLGRARTFAICSNARDLKLPSDLAGVTLARFDNEDVRHDVTSALGPACFQIRQAIRDLGLSDAKRLHGIRSAASTVEGLSDQIAHLVVLLAKSRVLELDVIGKQFGSMLPADFMERLRQDLAALENATSSSAYTDGRARYIGGHPKHDERADGTVVVDDVGITFNAHHGGLRFLIPKKDIKAVVFRMERLHFEQALNEEGVHIDPDATLLRPAAEVTMSDPEDIFPGGLKVRFGFRNEYHARLFEKKIADRYDVGPF